MMANEDVPNIKEAVIGTNNPAIMYSLFQSEDIKAIFELNSTILIKLRVAAVKMYESLFINFPSQTVTPTMMSSAIKG